MFEYRPGPAFSEVDLAVTVVPALHARTAGKQERWRLVEPAEELAARFRNRIEVLLRGILSDQVAPRGRQLLLRAACVHLGA